MSSNGDATGPLQNWLSILHAMGESVAQSLHSVANCEPDSTNDTADSAIPRDADFRRRLDSTIRGLEQRMDATRTLAGRIEVMLDRDEQEVRAWRATAEAARERLAAVGTTMITAFAVPDCGTACDAES